MYSGLKSFGGMGVSFTFSASVILLFLQLQWFLILNIQNITPPH